MTTWWASRSAPVGVAFCRPARLVSRGLPRGLQQGGNPSTFFHRFFAIPRGATPKVPMERSSTPATQRRAASTRSRSLVSRPCICLFPVNSCGMFLSNDTQSHIFAVLTSFPPLPAPLFPHGADAARHPSPSDIAKEVTMLSRLSHKVLGCCVWPIGRARLPLLVLVSRSPPKRAWLILSHRWFARGYYLLLPSANANGPAERDWNGGDAHSGQQVLSSP